MRSHRVRASIIEAVFVPWGACVTITAMQLVRSVKSRLEVCFPQRPSSCGFQTQSKNLFQPRIDYLESVHGSIVNQASFVYEGREDELGSRLFPQSRCFPAGCKSPNPKNTIFYSVNKLPTVTSNISMHFPITDFSVCWDCVTKIRKFQNPWQRESYSFKGKPISFFKFFIFLEWWELELSQSTAILTLK